MILGMISLVKVKLSKFPESVIKPAVINQDVVENHFCQLRRANDQNDNPIYLLTQATQNIIVFGQRTIVTRVQLKTHLSLGYCESSCPPQKKVKMKSSIRVTL